MVKDWFKKAIDAKPPYTLGWKISQPMKVRRSNALASRSKNWSLRRKRLSAGRALIALSNVTKSRRTKELARRDATYFFKLIKQKRRLRR